MRGKIPQTERNGKTQFQKKKNNTLKGFKFVAYKRAGISKEKLRNEAMYSEGGGPSTTEKDAEWRNNDAKIWVEKTTYMLYMHIDGVYSQRIVFSLHTNGKIQSFHVIVSMASK